MPRILVVDDEPDMLENYRRLLCRSGHTCVPAASAAEAIALVAGEPFDLVVTDLHLPGGDLDVMQRAQQRGVPVIVVTAHGRTNAPLDTFLLQKPFSNTDFAGLVERALGNG